MLVLGGAGFVGRHAALALKGAGAELVIGSRSPASRSFDVPAELRADAWHALRFEDLIDADTWTPIVALADVVLNCVGILRQRGNATYDRVHHRAPTALAAACARAGKRFVHVSALGLHDEARSGFLTSKLAGERGIRRSGGSWIIARPSLLDGEGGYGAAWLRAIARLPLFVAPADAKGRIAALDVGELGAALARLCLAGEDELDLGNGRIFELGGTEPLVFADYVRALRRVHTDDPILCIRIPGWTARIGAHLCDVFHLTPFSFGHWELLRRDNVPAVNRLPDLLERTPKIVGTTRRGERLDRASSR